MVAGKLVDEDDRRADAGFLVVELHAIVGSGMGHSGLRVQPDNPKPVLAVVV